ncbi:MAG: hypothetical protein PVG65_00190 [Candidatus Thorarchaeota archaeon]|jgi:hypothetical protein
MKIWDKFYECTCHAQMIVAHYDDEDKTVDLAFFHNFVDGRMTWWQRIKFCWKVLTTGEAWTDMVILDREEARNLGRDLCIFTEKVKDK